MTYPFIILSLFICFVLSLEYLPQFAADEFMFVLQGAGKGHSLLAAFPDTLLQVTVMFFCICSLSCRHTFIFTYHTLC